MEIIKEFKQIIRPEGKRVYAGIIILSIISIVTIMILVWFTWLLMDVRKSQLEQSMNINKRYRKQFTYLWMLTHYVQVLNSINEGNEEIRKRYFDECIINADAGRKIIRDMQNQAIPVELNTIFEKNYLIYKGNFSSFLIQFPQDLLLKILIYSLHL